MSAGNFTQAIYETDSGGFHNGRCQPETLLAEFNSVVNANGAGPITSAISAYMGGSRRRLGITARKVAIRFTGTPPTGYSGDPVDVTIMQKSVFDGILPGQAGTYLGAPTQVISKTAEQIR